MHMAQDEGDAVIVRSTIDLAHNLGIEVVAEGVENETAYRQLLEWGCDSAQGYFMSKPLPAEQFAAWIRETRWAPPSHGQKEVLDPDKDQIAS
jgi:EAL domain-containing protein (putative c-di-GMP-specific phosphodiesterase class I)